MYMYPIFHGWCFNPRTARLLFIASSMRPKSRRLTKTREIRNQLWFPSGQFTTSDEVRGRVSWRFFGTWLVVYIPLWKIWKSLGRINYPIYEMENIKYSKPPTSYIVVEDGCWESLLHFSHCFFRISGKLSSEYIVSMHKRYVGCGKVGQREARQWSSSKPQLKCCCKMYLCIGYFLLVAHRFDAGICENYF